MQTRLDRTRRETKLCPKLVYYDALREVHAITFKTAWAVTVKSFKLIDSDNPGKMFSFICNYTLRRKYHPTWHAGNDPPRIKFSNATKDYRNWIKQDERPKCYKFWNSYSSSGALINNAHSQAAQITQVRSLASLAIRLFGENFTSLDMMRTVLRWYWFSNADMAIETGSNKTRGQNVPNR